ncbi:uncharacterized protein ARMOST_17057 [Armillaria ostoyae]|uniref:Uncharacterized protein n=1 Tax=Armillaria ostoyae TaxID=47428 RepID=A0A284RXY4_ARMOS|nr:uncharacterized protein ARMOST_17057 [Armillaria ostoyae]
MTFYQPESKRKRKNWAAIPETPIIPAIPADASNYRLDSFTPLSISSLDCFRDVQETPVASSLPSASPIPLESPFQDISSQTSPYVEDPGSVRLRPVPQTSFEKVDDILELCSQKFGSLGEFLDVLFHSVPRRSKDSDPRSRMHINCKIGIQAGRLADLEMTQDRNSKQRRFSIACCGTQENVFAIENESNRTLLKWSKAILPSRHSLCHDILYRLYAFIICPYGLRCHSIAITRRIKEGAKRYVRDATRHGGTGLTSDGNVLLNLGADVTGPTVIARGARLKQDYASTKLPPFFAQLCSKCNGPS